MNKTLISLLVTGILIAQLEAKAEIRFSFEQLVNERDEMINDWIKNNQALTIKMTEQRSPKSLNSATEIKIAAQFQILLGDHDITSLFDYKNAQLTFSGGIPLPAGENELVVNQLINGEWQPIGSAMLSVMTSGGFQQAEWTPSLDLNINSQLDEQVSGDATKSDRPTYSDVTANIGLQSHHQKDELIVDSHISLFAVSNRQQAIQFGTRTNKARKIDLADYSVSIQNGFHNITLGHSSYGSNSLLIDNLSRRGLTWSYQNESDLTFNGAILNGTDIVGYNNFFGLSDHNEQFVNSLGFGFNAFTESRISLRVEGNYLDAESLSQSNFGIGEITSAEKNQGVGFKLSALDQDGRFNADLTLGFSRYTNPDDPGLNFGDDLFELKTETAMAHNLNLSYILVQNWQAPWGSETNINLNLNDSKAEPLYQTLTAFVQANLKNRLLGAQYQIGNVSGGLNTQSSQDNLDNLVNLLTTKTEIDSFNSNIPLAQILASEEDSTKEPWLPSLDYSYQKTHQFALNSPEFEQSGFNDNSHLPDQLTTVHSISSSWQFETVSISVQSNHSEQDNRQIGREQSDFSNLQHAFSLNLQQSETISWAFSFGKNRQFDKEQQKTQYSKSITSSFNWQSIEGLALSINYGLTKDDDSLNESKNLSTNADIGLVKNLIKGEWWLPVDGSISLRMNYNDNKSIDNVFDQQSRFGTKTAQLGINLSF